MKMPHDRDTSDHPTVHREWRYQWRCHCGHTWTTTGGAAPRDCPACRGAHNGAQQSSQLVEIDAQGVERIVHEKSNRRGE